MASLPIPFNIQAPFNVGGLPAPSMPFPRIPFSPVGGPSIAMNPYPMNALPGFGGNGGIAGIGEELSGVAGIGSNAPSGLARFLPSFLRPAAETTPLMGQLASRAGALKGLGYGIAGELGSIGAQKVLPGSGVLEHVLSGASKGAGTGAVAGLLGGPFAEVTAPVGAAVGGTLGGLAGLIFGGKKGPKETRPVDDLRRAMTATNLSPEEQHQFIKYYSILNTVGGDTAKSRVDSAAAVKQAVLQQFIANQSGAGNASTYHQMTPSENAAIQAQTAAFLAPYTQSTIDSAQASADYTMSHLDQVPEAYRGVVSTNAQQQLAASKRLANAYAAQAMLAPQAQALQNQQKYQMSLASQLQQQALQAQLQGTGGGGVDFSSLLSQGQQSQPQFG